MQATWEIRLNLGLEGPADLNRDHSAGKGNPRFGGDNRPRWWGLGKIKGKRNETKRRIDASDL